MANEIKKLKFKENTDLQIEVVSLQNLTKSKKELLVNPHRTNFYHIFLFENCQPTHLVDFEPIKIEPYSLLFIENLGHHIVPSFPPLLNLYHFIPDFLVHVILNNAGILSLLLHSLYFGRHVFGVDWPAASVGAVGGLLGVRAGINAITWVFGMALASPAPRLGFSRTARLMFDEYLAFLLTFVLVIPFERLWMPADRLSKGKQPILLVHGYGCSRGVWWLLRRRLEAAGHTVASVSLYPPYTSIGKLVPQLNERVEEVCRATGADRVVLIAHSMGGLICRSYLARHGRSRVERMITIASPHAGTELARIGIGRNAREMEPDSLWLKDLATENVPVPTISIRTPHDNYVMPQDNQRLPGAIDVEMDGIGHLSVLYAGRTAEELIAA